MPLHTRIRWTAVVLALASLLSPASVRADSAKKVDAPEQQALVDEARATFERFRHDPNLGWFREHEKEASGFLIVPKAVRAGFVFGGSGGRAVLVAKTDDGKWNGPAFYTAATASVGFQAGVDVSEIIVLVMTKKGLESLMSTSVKAGVDASAAAGPAGAGAGAGPTADFIYYSRSKGLYGGASFEGAVVKPSDDWNKAYYGELVSPIDILVRGSARNPAASLLLDTVGKAPKS